MGAKGRRCDAHHTRQSYSIRNQHKSPGSLHLRPAAADGLLCSSVLEESDEEKLSASTRPHSPWAILLFFFFFFILFLLPYPTQTCLTNGPCQPILYISLFISMYYHFRNNPMVSLTDLLWKHNETNSSLNQVRLRLGLEKQYMTVDWPLHNECRE